MAAVYNQYKHAGERYNDKVITSNLGFPYDSEKQKQGTVGGSLIICKCGYGFVEHDLWKIKKGVTKCPYCGR